MSGFTFGTPTSTPAVQQPAVAPSSLFGTPGTSTLGSNPGTTTISFFGTNTATTSASGFGFGTTATTSQPQQPTGFSFGGLGTTTTAPAQATGFSFGTTNVSAAAPSSTSTAPTSIMGTTPFGGLGGVPSSGNMRVSTLALGSDPGAGWFTRSDNRAVQELTVPSEIVALVEELKNEMKNHKTLMLEISRATDLDIDSVAEQIEEVRMSVSVLSNTIHKQELQTASLITDMQDLGKEMDLLSQTRDVPAYGHGGTSSMVLSFLYELLDKYSKRMLKYKVEIERAEFSLQTLMETYNLNAKDLWASLTAIKNTVIMLAAQVQQVHEDVRNELTVHKNFSQILLGSAPKPWLASAISGTLDPQTTVSPLERAMTAPSSAKVASSTTNLENLYSRTYSMLNRVPSAIESKMLQSASSESLLRSPAHDLRGSGLGGSAYGSAFHPSAMGTYLGPSSPVTNSGLKRSKK